MGPVDNIRSSTQLIYICTLPFAVFVKESQWPQRINHSKTLKFTINQKINWYFFKKNLEITETETYCFPLRSSLDQVCCDLHRGRTITDGHSGSTAPDWPIYG